MKIRLKFHLDWDNDDPEATVDDAVDAAHERARYEMTPREFDDLREKAVELAWDCLGKFQEDECCITVEFDTKAGTATVIPHTH